MNAGIPGIGIGGLFYIISGIAMLIYELFLAIIGRGAKARLLFALRQGWLIFLVILGLVVIDGSLIYLFKKIVMALNNGAANSIGNTTGILSVRPIFYAVFILLSMIFIVKLIGWFFRFYKPIPALQKKRD